MRNVWKSGRVENNDWVIATHWHDGVFSIVEKHSEQHKIRVRRYDPTSDQTESVSVEDFDAKVSFEFVLQI